MLQITVCRLQQYTVGCGVDSKLRDINITLLINGDVNNNLTLASRRSGRSKRLEAALRLQDHLVRFPDFYNSELVENMPRIDKKK